MVAEHRRRSNEAGMVPRVTLSRLIMCMNEDVGLILAVVDALVGSPLTEAKQQNVLTVT